MDQAELTPALERVAASVVETHRKRQQVEEELEAASAAVASLDAQSSSLEASVADLRRELEQALLVRAEEDAALKKLAHERHAAVEQLAAIALEIETFLSDKNRSANEIAAHTDAVRTKLRGVEVEVAAAKTALAAFYGDAKALRERLASVRQSADAVEGQLGDIQSKAHDLDGAVDGMAAKVSGIADALGHAERDRQHIVSASNELRAVTSVLETRRAQVKTADEAIEKLLSEKEKQTTSLAVQMERLSQLASSGRQQGQPTPTATEPTPMAEARFTPNGKHEFSHTVELIGVLVPLGFFGHDEASEALEILKTNDVDKFVRSLWSRAMGGPLPGPYRLILGSALSESGDHKGAMTFFNKALEGKHADPFLTYLVAVALLRMKRYVDVLRVAQGLGRTKDGRVLSRNVEALHLWGTGRHGEAEEKLAEALTVPSHSRLHHHETMYNLARLAEGRGDARTAALWYEKLASEDASYRDVAVHMDSLKTAEAHSL
jgi:tetratricopeptide (TPR) repeat protein